MSLPLRALLFGGCLVHHPLRIAAQHGAEIDGDPYGRIRIIHSFGEMLQTIGFLRGEIEVAREYREITAISPDLVPVPGARDFKDVDIVLIEPGSPIEYSFRGLATNRTHINHVLKPKFRDDPDAKALVNKWIRQGLAGLNEKVRAQTAQKMLAHVSGDSPNDAFARAVITETRAAPGDVLGGLKRMRALIDRPLGVISFVFRYMPDGRPISWPAGFREEMLQACTELGLPVFEPAPVVIDYGVQAALLKDHRHYSEAFLPVIGSRILDFARTLHGHPSAAPAV